MLRRMFRVLVIAVALATGACRDARLEELRSLRAEICACKTAACGEAVMGRVRQEGLPSDHRAQKIAKAMVECLQKLYLANRPTTDPDAEEPPEGEGAAPP
jgi:hypothetical protein